MSTQRLRWIAIILPLTFLGAIFILRAVFGEERGAVIIEGLFFLITIIGAIGFSTWVFNMVDQRESEIEARTGQLRGLHEAALSLTTELDLSAVLQKVVDLARSLVSAEYGALGVLDDDGRYIEQFVVSGLSGETRAHIGAPPRGRGILGVIIAHGESLILDDLGTDPRAAGFPPHHPPMRTFIGVPVRSKGTVIGNLYLTEKIAAPGKPARFDERDRQILEMFATQAAIAIENAQLYRQTRQLAVLQERERIGMDLHDGIIQSIYAIGLMLEDTQLRAASEPPEETHTGIARAIGGLNEVIRDIRNYILDLRPQRFQGRDLLEGMNELVRDLKANSFLDVQLSADRTRYDLSPQHTVEVLHIAQEALTNIRKHARSTRVQVLLSCAASRLVVEIHDNGVGLPQAALAQSGGNGLRNIRERTRNLGGAVTFEGQAGSGTRIVLTVPADC
jgi:signal transduction histidine kinase